MKQKFQKRHGLFNDGYEKEMGLAVRHLSDEQIQDVRATTLEICGPEKYNTLIRQHSEAVERGKLRFWQQKLFDEVIQRSSMPLDALTLYTLAFRDAEPVTVVEKPFVYPESPADALGFAIGRSDLQTIRDCFRRMPNVFEIVASKKLPTWVMCEAGKHGSPDTVRLLAELGCDLNQTDSNSFTGLCWAISLDRFEVAKTFLELGADPNRGLPLFGLFSELSNPLALAALLIEYGADPHQLKSIDDSPVDIVTRALQFGKTELADYFRSLGVQPARNQALHLEDEGRAGSPALRQASSNLSETRGKILRYFEEHFGKVATGSVEHIVPSEVPAPFAVHCIQSDLKSQRSILFTVGLSESTSDRVELMLGLPLGWPTLANAMQSATSAWPIEWMFRIGTHLIENGGTEDQDWTIVSDEAMVRPLADGIPFTCWALCGGKEPLVFDREADRVRILEMYPLYTEERELATVAGYIELLKRWQEMNVPEYIDPQRTNAAL